MWEVLWGMKPAGKHPEKKLTAIGIRALTKPGRYADGNGLYLIVDPSRAKRWLLRTISAGRRRDIGLGGLSTVSLADAREEAARLRKIARSGGDALAARRQKSRVVPTFEAAAKSVHAEHSAAFKNAKHKAQWLSSLSAYAFPFFGQRQVNQIEQDDVLRALSPIWNTKPETARRVRQRIKLVLDWSKVKGYRSGDNPVEGLARVLPKHRASEAHHASLKYVLVPAFIADLRRADASESVKLAFEFLILTATRTNEVLTATWPEIDLENLVWAIPGPRMKSGREHRIPLSARCKEILESTKALSHDEYVFPSRTRGKPLSNMVFEMALRRMKRTTITPHGFRASFRDWAAETTNMPRDVCEAALAHKLRDKTEAAYYRTDLFERRRELMSSWATFAITKPADIVPIRA